MCVIFIFSHLIFQFLPKCSRFSKSWNTNVLLENTVPCTSESRLGECERLDFCKTEVFFESFCMFCWCFCASVSVVFFCISGLESSVLAKSVFDKHRTVFGRKLNIPLLCALCQTIVFLAQQWSVQGPFDWTLPNPRLRDRSIWLKDRVILQAVVNCCLFDANESILHVKQNWW